MHRSPLPRCRPSPIALAAAITVALAAGWSPQALAQAGGTPPAAASSPITLDIPAQPMAQALNELARQANLQMSFPAALVAGKTAPAVSGQWTTRQALDRLLAGSGLVADIDGSSVLVRPRLAEGASEATLPTVRVATGTEVAPDELPAPYAGGQVARGARLRMLGNADVMTTPFSIKSYTNELIKDQGARSVDDVVSNDPSIRISSAPGHVLDQSSIRGYMITGASYTIDGLPGVISYSRIPVQNYERVEIFKGPTSALGGASVSGTTVGGSINLVPKRAMATPTAAATVGVTGDSVLETHVDLGRRFGGNNEWGARLNVFGESGEMSIGTRRRNLAPQVALDYAGDKLRATFDAGLVQYKNRKPGTNYTMAAGQGVPTPPKDGRSGQPDVAQQALDGRWAVVGAEYDLHPQWTVYGRYGKYYEESVDSFGANYSPLRSDGSFTISNYYYNTWKTDQNAKELGLRGRFETGPVKHQASLSALRFFRQYTAPPTGQSTPISTVSVPGNIYADYPTPYTNVVPTLGTYIGPEIHQSSIAVADSMTLLDDKLNVVVGLRRQRIEQQALGTALAYDAKKTSPMLGASFQLGGGWTVYGNHAEQLSQGAVAPTGTANAGQSLAPYTGKQKEVGVKWNAGSYGVTLAYFDIRQQSAFTDPADNVFKAGGEQRNKGVELETFGEVAKGVRLLGGVAYIDAKQTKTRLGATDGKQALGVGKNNVNLGAEVDVAAVPGLTLTGRVIYTGAAYVDLANTQQLPAWTRLDLGARYQTRVDGKAVTLRAGVNNVTNRAYWLAGARNIFSVAEPRTWRLSASVAF